MRNLTRRAQWVPRRCGASVKPKRSASKSETEARVCRGEGAVERTYQSGAVGGPIRGCPQCRELPDIHTADPFHGELGHVCKPLPLLPLSPDSTGGVTAFPT